MENRHEQPEGSTTERVFARCPAVLVDPNTGSMLSFAQGDPIDVTDCGREFVIVKKGKTSITIPSTALQEVTVTGPDAATAIGGYVRDLCMAHGASTHTGL